VEPQAPAVHDVVFEERYWYPDDRNVIWIAGCHVDEPKSGR
jgi:hypothetical protein